MTQVSPGAFEADVAVVSVGEIGLLRARIGVSAVGVGLTELGRFAVEYRRLFGESPSATISRSP